MSRVLNVAVVGCGIGRSHIVEGYLPNADKFRVVAICDLNPERLEEIGNEFGIERRILNFAELLTMDDVDIIDVCTPPGAHFMMVTEALKAGKHVVCEKPLVGSLADVDAILEVEKTAKGKLMPVFQYRFGNGIEQAKRIIDAGLAGKPYCGTVETMWRREAPYYAVPWRGKWKTELGGVLMGHAIHPHDIFTYLMGDIARVFGRVATRVNPIEVEAGRAVRLDVPELEALDGREVQEPHLAHERLEESLGDKDDARRPTKLGARGDETLQRLGILETPRVRFEGSDEHRVVRGETEHEDDRDIAPIQRGELDRRPSEVEVGREDLEIGLHRVGVVRDEAPQVLQVCDFSALECLHRTIPDRLSNRYASD